jgi:hypothetical protein
MMGSPASKVSLKSSPKISWKQILVGLCIFLILTTFLVNTPLLTSVTSTATVDFDEPINNNSTWLLRKDIMKAKAELVQAKQELEALKVSKANEQKQLPPPEEQPASVASAMADAAWEESHPYYTTPPLDDPKFNLWDNSTTLPQWLKNYFAWAREERAKVNETNWQNFRFLLSRAIVSEENGGTMERIRGLPKMLRIAADTKRLVIIFWNRPFALEHFLMPPIGGLDWRAPSFLAPKMQFNFRGTATAATNVLPDSESAKAPNLWGRTLR